MCLLQMENDSQAMKQEGLPAHESKQPSMEEADMSVAEQGSSEQACCELCEQGVHNKEDCPLVVAAQECDPTPEGEEAEETEWQVVAGKASKAQAKGNKGAKGGNGKKGNKAGKGTKGGNGKKDNKESKELGKAEKVGDATTVITLHRDGSSGWVPVKTPLGSRDGSGSNKPGSN